MWLEGGVRMGMCWNIEPEGIRDPVKSHLCCNGTFEFNSSGSGGAVKIFLSEKITE